MTAGSTPPRLPSVSKGARIAGAILLLAASASAAELDDDVNRLLDQVRARSAAQRAAPDSGLPDAYRASRAPARDALDAETFCVKATLPDDPGFDYCVNESESRGFTLSNSTSPRINPVGGGVRRDYEFSAPQNARQETGLLVYEWGTTDAGADDSAWSMLSEIIFLPRRVTPSVRLSRSGAEYEVTLPDGELVAFDAATKEIVGGVLMETAPIDTNKDRFARKFAGLKYRGRGVMIRSDQRGDSPRSAVVWGQKKYATAVWGAKTCRLSPADVWSQDQTSFVGSPNLYPTDDAFFAMLRAKCGWSVSAADFD